MITPEMLAKNGTEDCHQAALFCWAALPETQLRHPELRVLLFAIPNGGFRDKITAAKLKATGVKAGTPDIFLAVPRGGYAGMFVEMKKPGGRVSTEQRTFLEEAGKHHYAGVVAVGWESARDAIVRYLTVL